MPHSDQPLTPFEQEIAAALKNQPQTRSPDCLDQATLNALVRQQMAEAEIGRSMAHIAFCAACRRGYLDTQRSWRLAQEIQKTVLSSTAPERPSLAEFLRRWFTPPALTITAVGAVAALILFAIIRPHSDPHSQQEIARLQSQTKRLQTALQESWQENAANQHVIAEQSRQIMADKNEINADRKKLDAINAALNSAKRENLAANPPPLQVAMNVPADLAQVSPPADQVRGTDPQRQPMVELIYPIAYILETRPHFQWKTFKGAESYTLKIYTSFTSPPVRSIGRLKTPEWTWPDSASPLEEGKLYYWQVTAYPSNTKPVTSLQMPFKLMDPQKADEIRLEIRAGTNRLLRLGVLYANKGLVSDARWAFETVLKADPQNRMAKQRLAELEKQLNALKRP